MEAGEKVSAVLECLGNAEGVIVDSSPFDIGRCRTAKLIIPHVNVSRNHCHLTFTEKQKWIIEDLSSSGTFVNDKLVGKGNSVEIKNKDLIRLGPKDCSFIWKFKTNLEKDESMKTLYVDIDSQSQTIADLCTEKDILQRKIILNRESCQEMMIEKEKLHKQYWRKVRELEEKFSSDREAFENQLGEIKKIIQKNVEEEKKNVRLDMEEKLLILEEKINKNNRMEEKLKSEIQVLQEKLISEQCQWETRFLEEKRKLENQINEQSTKLAVEKLKIEEIAQMHEQQMENKLKKDEEEKKMLLSKLHEIEEAKNVLSLKLKESDKLLLTDNGEFEKELQEGLKNHQENVKSELLTRYDYLQKTEYETETNIRAKSEEKENTNNQNLLEELDRVKHTLIQSECRQKLLEKKLAEASTSKDEMLKVKSNVLENIADLMESELQCSICSELFVTAITLNCMHTFCKDCIGRWKKKKKTCPICRVKITSENRSIVMDNYIDKMVENLSDDFKSRRKSVIAERNAEAPEKRRKSNPPPFGRE